MLYVGPLADIAGGVHLSTIGAAAPRGDLPRLRQFHRGMTRSADELVTEFCKKWAKPDPEELAGYFTGNGVYHNGPMDAVQGTEAIKEFIAGFTAGFEGIDYQVHRQLGQQRNRLVAGVGRYLEHARRWR
jgi:hypothetical protein